jgi:hypothetical protein
MSIAPISPNPPTTTPSCNRETLRRAAHQVKPKAVWGYRSSWGRRGNVTLCHFTVFSSIEIFVDDVSRGNIACCTARADVQAAFPTDANAGNSGFGFTVNWGELAAGSHTIRVEIRPTAGASIVIDTRTITVVKPGDFSFLIQFAIDVDTSFAQAEKDNTLCVENVQITDKNSGTTKFVKGIFRWQEACQCLTLISTEEEGYCDF